MLVLMSASPTFVTPSSMPTTEYAGSKISDHLSRPTSKCPMNPINESASLSVSVNGESTSMSKPEIAASPLRLAAHRYGAISKRHCDSAWASKSGTVAGAPLDWPRADAASDSPMAKAIETAIELFMTPRKR